MKSAGIGSRLGMGLTKALVRIAGKPLIAWQLELLSDVEDVRIVVGYQAEQVMEEALLWRKNVSFFFNPDFLSTGPAQSLTIGTKDALGMVLSLDGDVLVHPEDLAEIIRSDDELIGICDVSTDEPLYVNTIVTLAGLRAVSFSRESGSHEWTGLVQIHADKLQSGYKYVYQMVEPYLPLSAVKVRSCEIDTPRDYERAVKWVFSNMVVNKEIVQQLELKD